jgi:hypothetical protein
MEIPGWALAVNQISEMLQQNPEVIEKASNLAMIYANRRGTMVVDVVASRQRNYEKRVAINLIPFYESTANDSSLQTLAAHAPTWMPLRNGEADTMSQVAEQLLKYGLSHTITDENEICEKWSSDTDAVKELLLIKGIGPALLQYLRMLSGANTIKIDLRVIRGLGLIGLPVEWFTADGLLELCRAISEEVGCTLLELDQVLFQVIGAQ